MTLHLSTLKSICQSWDQLYSFVKSSWRVSRLAWSVTLPNILVSSANLRIQLVIPKSMSFIYIKNSTGPRTDPWGTPLQTSRHDDCSPFIQTLWLRSDSQLLIHLSTLSWIPWPSTFANNLLCGTLSKALAKSRYITSIFSPLSILKKTLSKKTSRLLRHELPRLNPCCKSLIDLGYSQWWRLKLFIVCSALLNIYYHSRWNVV